MGSHDPDLFAKLFNLYGKWGFVQGFFLFKKEHVPRKNKCVDKNGDVYHKNGSLNKLNSWFTLITMKEIQVHF